MVRQSAPVWGDYLIAFGVSILALLLRGLLDPVLGEHIPYMISIFAVMVVSTTISFYPTLLALTIGLLGTRYFFVEPRHQFWTDDPMVRLGFLLFATCGFGCTWVGWQVQKSRLRALRHREELVEQRAINQNEILQRREVELDLERKQNELRESQAIFTKLIEMVPQFVWMADADGKVTFFNHRWYEFTGLTPEHCLKEGWLTVLHPDDLLRTSRRWAQAVERGEVYQVEYRLRAADGSYRWFLGRGEPYRDAAGKVVQWFGTCTDIDEQRRVTDSLDQIVRDRTQQLTETNRALREEIEERKAVEEREKVIATELRRSNEELEKFAYVASHDLQEPLRKIQSFGDRLNSRARGSLDEAGNDSLDRILRAAGRMRRLIDDLLSLSRVSTKKRQPVSVDLNAILRDVLTDLEVVVTQAGASVEAGPLPTVLGDPVQMQQLFQNLIGNALKFRKPDEPVHLRITGGPVPGSNETPVPLSLCELRFADNGIGFDEKYLDRIFQVFQRLHGRAEYEGTGIGLAICRKIVEQHGGSITAHSRPDQGSTFIVTLPLAPTIEQERGPHEGSGSTRDDPCRGR
jgi:PAS domain S-box-containing protein